MITHNWRKISKKVNELGTAQETTYVYIVNNDIYKFYELTIYETLYKTDNKTRVILTDMTFRFNTHKNRSHLFLNSSNYVDSVSKLIKVDISKITKFTRSYTTSVLQTFEILLKHLEN